MIQTPSGIPIMIAQNGKVPCFVDALKSIERMMIAGKN